MVRGFFRFAYFYLQKKLYVCREPLKIHSMKTNTVTIDLETYNELRDFKKNILEGKIYHRYQFDTLKITGKEHFFFYTESEAVKKVVKEYQSLKSLHSLRLAIINESHNQEIEKIKKDTERETRKKCLEEMGSFRSLLGWLWKSPRKSKNT